MVLETKQHYQVLDGLRGVAAITVVIFHFMEIAIPNPAESFITHAYLAVDFFFCLSGFVIAYAYDNRIQIIGIKSFLKLRLIRLHPLVVIGTIWGMIAFMVDPFSDLFTKYQPLFWPMLITSLLMIPYAVVPERYFNIFHLNPPSWSLFWEYVGSIVYALILVRVGKKVLWTLAIVGAIALFIEAHHATNLGVGWSGDNFWGGGVRAFFPFVAGILVYRSGFVFRSKFGFLLPSLLLMIAFLIPFSTTYNWFVEPLVVILYFPLLLALGAGAVPGHRTEKVCTFFGEISYPLYMIHYPFIWIFFSYVQRYKPSLQEMSIITVAGTLLLIFLSYLVLVFIDKPIRQYLKRKIVLR
ncbi:acyltransferase family protein [Pseudochryseolinea flava]|nr:acyltransferase [Pseudochryseolinea flava]